MRERAINLPPPRLPWALFTVAVIAGCAGTKTGAPAAAPSVDGMVQIPACTFIMGESTGRPDESPHEVSRAAFYIDASPVSQEFYGRVMGVNPSKQKNRKNPVERTQWTDAVRF